MTTLPAACTLSAPDLAAVRDRYIEAANHYRATAVVNADRADISLVGDRSVLVQLLDEMVERESGCCAFLRFDVTETTEGLDVRLSVRETSGIDRDILREMVAALFPGSTTPPA